MTRKHKSILYLVSCLNFESIGPSFLLEDETQSCLAESLPGWGPLRGIGSLRYWKILVCSLPASDSGWPERRNKKSVCCAAWPSEKRKHNTASHEWENRIFKKNTYRAYALLNYGFVGFKTELWYDKEVTEQWGENNWLAHVRGALSPK